MSFTIETLRAGFVSDFLSVDGLEFVTYRRRDDNGDLSMTLVVKVQDENDEDIPCALPRQETNDLLIDDKVIMASEIGIWHILIAPFPAFPWRPQKGDEIVDVRNTIWIVKGIQTQTLNIRYRFTCVRERGT